MKNNVKEKLEKLFLGFNLASKTIFNTKMSRLFSVESNRCICNRNKFIVTIARKRK